MVAIAFDSAPLTLIPEVNLDPNLFVKTNLTVSLALYDLTIPTPAVFANVLAEDVLPKTNSPTWKFPWILEIVKSSNLSFSCVKVPDSSNVAACNVKLKSMFWDSVYVFPSADKNNVPTAGCLDIISVVPASNSPNFATQFF